MRLDMVRTFVQVARAGSVAAAARLLCCSQSTVLYHLRELEKAWSIELFQRNLPVLTLTDRGEEAVVLALHLLAVARELEGLSRRPSKVRLARRTGSDHRD